MTELDRQFGILVGLRRINDLDLIQSRSIYREIGFLDRERETVIRIAELIAKLFHDYDYTESIEYQRSLVGKSAAYVSMKKRLFDDKKANAKLLNFSRHLEKVRESDSVLEFLPESKHPIVFEIRGLLDQIDSSRI